jgi:hypothetical protein
MEPYEALPLDASNECLGAAVMRALQEAGKEIPWPKDWNTLKLPLWNTAGVKSDSQFVRGTRAIQAKHTGRDLQIWPTKNGGVKHWFTWIEDKTFAVPVPSSEDEVGRAVLQGLQQSE